jgi:hypothetical protein
MTRRHSAGSYSQVFLLEPVMPALLTRISTCPSAAFAAFAAAATDCSLVTSTVTLCAPSLFAASVSASPSMSQSETFAPDALSRSAQA